MTGAPRDADSRAADPSAIDARGVEKAYRVGPRTVPALRGLDLLVQRGRFVMLEGRSGAGKSTLLNTLAGLDRPDAGEISLAGRRVTGASEDELVELRRTTVATIYQSFALLPLLTAEENVGVPLRMAGTPVRERDERVAELLEQVGLAKHAKQRPDELSGGQLQRVAIARALASRPQVLLADEPTGQLDTRTGNQIMGLLRELVDVDGVTALVVSHDRLLEHHVDEVLQLVDGRVVAGGAAA